MTTPHNRRLKIINFTLDGTEYSSQIQSWTVSPGIKDGNREYTFSSLGEGNNSFVEDTDGEPTLDIKFVSDWTAAGLSDYLWQNNAVVVDFVIDHHPDIAGEHVRVSGQVKLKAPDMGGDARATETQEVSMPIIGAIPAYERV